REMSRELQASLWNVLHIFIWDRPGFLWHFAAERGDIVMFAITPTKSLASSSVPTSRWNGTLPIEFLESVVEIRDDPDLVAGLNGVLGRELSGYRIVGNRFLEITHHAEIESVRAAIEDDRFAPVAAHLQSAVDLMANRENPDYRNSIKESISSVESMARILS